MSLEVYPPLEFFEIVWEEEVLVLLGMFGKSHTWSHLVYSFCSLEFFDYCFNLTRCNLSIQILWFFMIIVLEGSMFLGIYQFLSRLSNLLAYSCFYFLKILCIFFCISCYYPSFHSWFYLFAAYFSLSWWVWWKICQCYLSFQRTISWIHWSFLFFFRLYSIYFSSDLYYFLLSTHFGLCLLFFF